MWRRRPQRPRSDAGLKRLNLPHLPRLAYAIGDVHGCLDLYQALETAIVADMRRDGANEPALLIVLGDIVDRGPGTAQLIDHLIDPAPTGLTRVILRGNHEDMMLRFLEDARGNMNWLEFGGRETLASYGAVLANLDAGAKPAGAQARAVVPPAHVDFLNDLPLCLTAGPYLFSHAGCDPLKPVDRQTADDLMWSDPAVLDTTPAPLICVHGHVPVQTVMSLSSRIAIDTGACATGRLSAVKLGTNGIKATLVAQQHDGSGTVSVDVQDVV